MRTFYQNQILKLDPFDGKNFFRNAYRYVILTQSKKASNYEEFEERVISKMKKWIKVNRPVCWLVEGPWVDYVNR